MKRVLFQGLFDILNYGHIEAFKFAKSQGDYLIVALNTNSLIKNYKNRVAIMPWWHKKKIIESIKYVDKVVSIGNFSPIELLAKYKINVFVIGDEWVHTKAEEIAYMKEKGGITLISPRYGGISTTIIKERLLKEYSDAQKQVNPRQSGLCKGRQAAAHYSNGRRSPYTGL